MRLADPKVTLSLLATLAFCALPAGAGIITVDFDTYPSGSSVPAGPSASNQWSSFGVVFSRSGGGPAHVNSEPTCARSSPNHVGLGSSDTITATFIDPNTGLPGVTDFAGTAQDNCWFPSEGITMRAFDIDGGLLGSIFNSGAGNFEAFSFPSPIIARLEMETLNQAIDDFQFNTPVAAPLPATAILLLSGVLVLIGNRRSRQQRNTI
jgi:hypothetical protein